VVGPLAAGLVLTGGGLIAVTALAAGGGSGSLAVTAATILLVLLLPWNPLWWIALGAGLGLLGVI
jgi:hypothetical protein